MELTELTLTDAARLISQGEVSPLELTRAHLDRIHNLEPRLNCFITLTEEDALRRAKKAEQAIIHGEYLGRLHGIPIAVKDIYETAGIRTTVGSKFFDNYVPGEDCTVMDSLNAAGVICLGKLNMHEIALGVTTNNPHFGACHNPWQLDLSPGGSSGGSGAALAAEMCIVSLGTDTGGSIRIPASLCGIVGLKPTYGRVSLKGVIPLSWNLDHAGPMARRVTDVAILLRSISGYDPLDPYSIDHPVDDYLSGLETSIKGWRVGLASDPFFTNADEEILEAVRTAGSVFIDLGAKVDQVEIIGGREAAQSNGLMTTSDAAAFHAERLQNHPEGFGEDVLKRLQTGAAYTSMEYIQARRNQTLLRRQFEGFFQDYDVFLTPTTPIAAPPLQGPDAIQQAGTLTRFTSPFNLTGLPAISLPCGFTSAGLPIGLQIISKPWAEAQVLQTAHAFEQATSWHLQKPKT
jgi:aspartyl-tRNA(Asn)/glutamyl-tRNA(Gln) amidotransferase subunit A